MTKTRFALLVTPFLAACSAEAPPDPAALEASLRSAAEAYHAAASAKDRDGVVAFYDPAAVMVPPGADLVEGLDGVAGYRFGFIETEGVSLAFRIQRVAVSATGDMGWTLALGDITIERPDGPPGKDLVRDFHAWRRLPDGSWKVVVDMWNSGPVAEVGPDGTGAAGAP